MLTTQKLVAIGQIKRCGNTLGSVEEYDSKSHHHTQNPTVGVIARKFF